MDFQKTPGNESFTSLDDLQRAQNHYVRDNPQEDIPEEIPERDLLESIILNQEHLYQQQKQLYQQQESIFQTLNKNIINLYKKSSSDIADVTNISFFVLLLGGLTLIPTCHRQKKMYNLFKEQQQLKTDSTTLMQVPSAPIDSAATKAYQFYGLPR